MEKLDLESGADGNTLWIGLMYQAGVAKFDKKTEKFTIYAVTKDGKAVVGTPLWVNGSLRPGNLVRMLSISSAR